MDYEMIKAMEEKRITDAADELCRLMADNEMRPAAARVVSSTYIGKDGDCFLAVNGQAGRMTAVFAEFFRERPEFRATVQRALNEIFEVRDY